MIYEIPVFLSPIREDCGPTCLKMIFAYYGVNVTQENINAECNVRYFGCNLRDMKNAAINHGFENTKAYHIDYNGIITINRPCVLWWRHKHFIVYTGFDDETSRPYVIDPDLGRAKMPPLFFRAIYSGIAMYFENISEVII